LLPLIFFPKPVLALLAASAFLNSSTVAIKLFSYP
jgi:hypothetical protein